MPYRHRARDSASPDNTPTRRVTFFTRIANWASTSPFVALVIPSRNITIPTTRSVDRVHTDLQDEATKAGFRCELLPAPGEVLRLELQSATPADGNRLVTVVALTPTAGGGMLASVSIRYTLVNKLFSSVFYVAPILFAISPIIRYLTHKGTLGQLAQVCAFSCIVLVVPGMWFNHSADRIERTLRRILA